VPSLLLDRSLHGARRPRQFRAVLGQRLPEVAVMSESDCVGGVVTPLLNGLFEVDDRGDGIAEIRLRGDFGEITAQDVEAFAAWDARVGRPVLPVPIGFKITSLVVGYVHGEFASDGRDESDHWVRTVSAFPGLADITGAQQERVASLQDLEQYIRANRDAAFRLWLEYSRPTDRRC
jgi:hypothetical protein